jgi:hypothetical protein
MRRLILSGCKRRARLTTGATGAPVNVVTFVFVWNLRVWNLGGYFS